MYGNLYTKNNVAISATHTHAGPGGYLQYFVYLVTSFGFVRQSFDALVDGIEQSIIQAHDSLQPGSIYVNKGSSTMGNASVQMQTASISLESMVKDFATDGEPRGRKEEDNL
ncbi:neutral ceramidase 3-like [Olea europaea var. sylvestris]|uniref:Neutral/alkaline non-lysosomal ceramidase N-terminal domain-containing protein n=1 Tax=Olea europaea subsp. europaea TaxID=158383 RepID=A0A8S0TGG8_OLEEU|nr:neutral ceramidase 3-like [Olea europaea var. sylvestris]CAA3004664.1 Hypothetical predicted protein [Olea europaea subsp. europaea]